MARLGGDEGGVEGGTFSSEKAATSDDGKSDEGADSLSSLSITETRRRLIVSSRLSWCFLLEYVFEYVLRGGLKAVSILSFDQMQALTYLFVNELMIIILWISIMCCRRRQKDGMRRVAEQKTRSRRN